MVRWTDAASNVRKPRTRMTRRRDRFPTLEKGSGTGTSRAVPGILGPRPRLAPHAVRGLGKGTVPPRPLWGGPRVEPRGAHAPGSGSAAHRARLPWALLDRHRGMGALREGPRGARAPGNETAAHRGRLPGALPDRHRGAGAPRGARGGGALSQERMGPGRAWVVLPPWAATRPVGLHRTRAPGLGRLPQEPLGRRGTGPTRRTWGSGALGPGRTCSWPAWVGPPPGPPPRPAGLHRVHAPGNAIAPHHDGVAPRDRAPQSRDALGPAPEIETTRPAQGDPLRAPPPGAQGVPHKLDPAARAGGHHVSGEVVRGAVDLGSARGERGRPWCSPGAGGGAAWCVVSRHGAAGRSHGWGGSRVLPLGSSSACSSDYPSARHTRTSPRRHPLSSPGLLLVPRPLLLLTARPCASWSRIKPDCSCSRPCAQRRVA